VTDLKRLGCDSLAMLMDVTDADSVERVVTEAVERCGCVDVLVNSAGIGIFGAMEDLTLADWRRVVDIDLWGSINVDRAIWPTWSSGGRDTSSTCRPPTGSISRCLT